MSPRPRAHTATRPPPASAGSRAPEAREAAWSIPSLREPRYSQSLKRGLAMIDEIECDAATSVDVMEMAEKQGRWRDSTATIEARREVHEIAGVGAGQDESCQR